MKEKEIALKAHILNEVFKEFPTLNTQHPFDFFMEADVENVDFVDQSPLGTEWGYEVKEEHEIDDIRAIRGQMQNMYDSLIDIDLTPGESEIPDEIVQKARNVINDVKSGEDAYSIAQWIISRVN